MSDDVLARIDTYWKIAHEGKAIHLFDDGCVPCQLARIAREQHEQVLALQKDSMDCDEAHLADGEQMRQQRAELRVLRERAEKAEAINQSYIEKGWMTLGVGDGRGQRFVHGDYESIEIVRNALEDNARLREALAPFAETEECGIGVIVSAESDHRCAECSRILTARAAMRGKE